MAKLRLIVAGLVFFRLEKGALWMLFLNVPPVDGGCKGPPHRTRLFFDPTQAKPNADWPRSEKFRPSHLREMWESLRGAFGERLVKGYHFSQLAGADLRVAQGRATSASRSPELEEDFEFVPSTDDLLKFVGADRAKFDPRLVAEKYSSSRSLAARLKVDLVDGVDLGTYRLWGRHADPVAKPHVIVFSDGTKDRYQQFMAHSVKIEIPFDSELALSLGKLGEEPKPGRLAISPEHGDVEVLLLTDFPLSESRARADDLPRMEHFLCYYDLYDHVEVKGLLRPSHHRRSRTVAGSIEDLEMDDAACSPAQGGG